MKNSVIFKGNLSETLQKEDTFITITHLILIFT